jgi:23S rRNA (cytosine1962-C5)-methyltransferase
MVRMNPRVILKPGKDKAIKNHHHWIFSGAVAHIPEFNNGGFYPVYNDKEILLGYGYFNSKAKIIGRMVCFDDTPPLEAIKTNLDTALHLRTILFHGKDTNSYRLVNGEGDCLPGLVIDKYNNVLVIQISTLGMEKLRNWLIEYLVRKINPQTIYEKSIIPSRKEEGLNDFEGLVYGNPIDEIEILENGLSFIVSILEGQKTGFFLDHREMRQFIKALSPGKKVLNCFSYTGGFSVYAAAGGAVAVASVDISQKAIKMASRNMAINSFDKKIETQYFADDVFKFLREKDLDYNIIILDPPAFAKKQKDVVQACRGYKDINRIAMQKMPKNSFLLTSSCSHYVDEPLFQKVVFQASVEAQRQVKIIGRHQIAADHPINICHPESDYLKSLLLYVE